MAQEFFDKAEFPELVSSMTPANCVRLAFFFLLVGLAGCGGPSYSWKERLVVVVDTPDGPISASSVRWVKWRRDEWSAAAGVGGWRKYVRAEAVVIDLGSTPRGPRYLFALLGAPSTTAIKAIQMEYGFTDSQSPKIEWYIDRILNGRRRSYILSPVHYPLLVAFGDISNSATVKRVDPNNLVATFGVGYGLNSMALEFTEDPITEGRVIEVLDWLKSVGPTGGGTLIPLPKDRDLTKLKDIEMRTLTPGAFSTELFR